VAREIRLHSDLAHDSIIALYSAWKDRAYVYMALEWAPGVRQKAGGKRLRGGRVATRMLNSSLHQLMGPSPLPSCRVASLVHPFCFTPSRPLRFTPSLPPSLTTSSRATSTSVVLID
jgi:hypothetical protein